MKRPPAISAARYEAVAGNLEVLASPVRLAILSRLRKPAPLHLIRVETPPGDGESGRILSRQAVTWHLNQLMAAGLVQPLPGDERSPLYVLNHERLFALVDEMRELSRLQALDGVAPGVTMERDATSAKPAPKGPRLLLVYGRDEGTAFPLGDTIVLGREPGCDVRLDYDAYASGRHARITRGDAGFVLEDLGSRNGTRVNGVLLPVKRARRLHPGDVLTIGRSHLAYQHPPP